jgi:guanine deaminase
MRSYNEIRPNALYCKEWIYKIDFEKNMKIAIEEAKKSLNEGNKGYGAVIIFDNELISRTHDTVFTENDPSLHAETKAIKDAAKKLRDKNLCGSILFSTCEPCPMCSSLAVWSNITTIIFGASIIDTYNIGKERILINTKEILEKSPVNIELIGGVLKQECLDLYREVNSVKTT